MRFRPRFEAAQSVLLGTVGILAGACFALSLSLPVYTDEIVWKSAQGRMAEDGGALSLTFQPSCGPYAIAVPALLYPFRQIDGALYRVLADPLAIRVFGVTLALAWLGLAGALGSRLADGRLTRGTIAAMILGFATLGVMPLLLVVSRPEQILLLGFTAFFLTLLAPPPPLPSRGACVLHAAGAVLLVAFVLAAHPRGVFALPLMLAFLWRVARRPAVVAVAGAAIMVFAAVAYRDWAARWACPGDPQFASILVYVNLASAIEQHVFIGYVRDLVQSFASGTAWYFREFIPKTAYTAGILPGFANPMLGAAFAVAFAIFVVWGLFAYLAALLSRAWREDRFAVAGVGALWLFYFAALVSRIDKNDYEAALMEPVMAMAALGSFRLAWPHLAGLFGAARIAVAARAGLLVLLGLSAASEVMVLANYLPHAAGAWREPGSPPDQPISVSVAGYHAIEPRILAAARLCGIDAAVPGEHLVVSETTSFAFRRSRQPFFVTFFENGWGQFRPDPTGLWRQEHSAGMIVACERVPLPLVGQVTRSGGFCCLPSFAPS